MLWLCFQWTLYLGFPTLFQNCWKEDMSAVIGRRLQQKQDIFNCPTYASPISVHIVGGSTSHQIHWTVVNSNFGDELWDLQLRWDLYEPRLESIQNMDNIFKSQGRDAANWKKKDSPRDYHARVDILLSPTKQIWFWALQPVLANFKLCVQKGYQ